MWRKGRSTGWGGEKKKQKEVKEEGEEMGGEGKSAYSFQIPGSVSASITHNRGRGVKIREGKKGEGERKDGKERKGGKGKLRTRTSFQNLAYMAWTTANDRLGSFKVYDVQDVQG